MSKEKKMKAAEMSEQELISAAEDYKTGMLEGGEGYNPYRVELDRRVRETEAARPKTRDDHISALHKRVRVECGSVAREWGDIAAIDALQDELYAQIDALKAEIEAEFLGTWTKDETIARRAAWNEMVKAGRFGKIGGGRVNYVALNQQEEKQGWTMADLKKAIGLHGLK